VRAGQSSCLTKAVHVKEMGKQEMREVLVGRSPGGRQGSNIKIDIREIGCECVN
jgi:hypothetical protein